MNKNVLRRIASLQLQGKDGYNEDFLALLSNDSETLAKWSVPLTATDRTDRNNAIFDRWLAGETSTELAKKCYLRQSAIVKVIKNITATRLERSDITEQAPIYNVWNYSSCDTRFGQKHPGQIPGQAVINLLLWLTEPFDMVVDPMVGGGTTIDVCRYLLRRYYCSDLKPKRPDIRQWDICKGYPRLPRKPKFVLLDPPYWRLKRDEYSDDGVAMRSYEEWLAFIQKLAKDTHKVLQPGGHAALFIESFLDERETERFLFLNRDCLNLFEAAGFEGIQEISVNMPSQIKTFRDVMYAKSRNILLDLKREVFVFRK